MTIARIKAIVAEAAGGDALSKSSATLELAQEPATTQYQVTAKVAAEKELGMPDLRDEIAQALTAPAGAIDEVTATLREYAHGKRDKYDALHAADRMVTAVFADEKLQQAERIGFRTLLNAVPKDVRDQMKGDFVAQQERFAARQCQALNDMLTAVRPASWLGTLADVNANLALLHRTDVSADSRAQLLATLDSLKPVRAQVATLPVARWVVPALDAVIAHAERFR